MFWDKIAGIYDLYQIMNSKVNNKTASICASYITNEDIVLECACGTGIMTRFIAPPSKKLIATDFSKPMLKKAKNNLKKHNNIQFKYADITNLPFKDNTFDKVIAANVIHLLDNPENALLELKRVVKPNGIIIIPTYIAEETTLSIFATKIFNKMGANFKNTFNEETYKKFIKNMGLKAEYYTISGTIGCCIAVIKRENKVVMKT